MRTIAILFLLTAQTFAQSQYVQSGSNQIYIEGRKAEDLSKPELLCALYSVWYHMQQTTCHQSRSLYGTKLPEGMCGEALKQKAEACKQTN